MVRKTRVFIDRWCPWHHFFITFCNAWKELHFHNKCNIKLIFKKKSKTLYFGTYLVQQVFIQMRYKSKTYWKQNIRKMSDATWRKATIQDLLMVQPFFNIITSLLYITWLLYIKNCLHILYWQWMWKESSWLPKSHKIIPRFLKYFKYYTHLVEIKLEISWQLFLFHQMIKYMVRW